MQVLAQCYFQTMIAKFTVSIVDIRILHRYRTKYKHKFTALRSYYDYESVLR